VNPVGEIELACEFLNLPDSPSSFNMDGFKDYEGNPWAANSSFGSKSGINNSSVGKYSQNLTEEQINLIEACCWPELKSIGYELNISRSDVGECIGKGIESEKLERNELSNYLFNDLTIKQEFERWELLNQKPIGKNTQNHFVFESSLTKLQLASNLMSV
ncbi:MAG: hypothetical protein MK073_08110, partial [Phycisphaerales bacterium]|nr:hypothetical protein [Phycisphaerales bacterium]